MLLETPICDFGWKAPDFTLKDPDGHAFTLSQNLGDKGLLVMFICNHCPYVQAVLDKIVRDARDLAREGVGVIAISSNDPSDYPEDSFEQMKRVAKQHSFGFPYAFDETQEVARAYGAVCTPDFFGFDRDLRLAYRGRLDDSGRSPKEGNRRELYEAMVQTARTGKAPAEQHPAMGCSIKWKSA